MIDKVIAPFTIISASIHQGGYLGAVVNENGSPIGTQGIELVNTHEDKVFDIEGTPLQSPFTERWVGGNSHRHVDINNDGLDNARNRPEAWHTTVKTTGLRLHSHRIYNSPPAYWTRDEAAKRPLNIKNILTTTASVAQGNFRLNYEVIQAGGRTVNSLLRNILTGSESAGSLRTRFVTGSNLNVDLNNTRRNSQTLDTAKNKTVIVSRFNAPGGVNESTRASLDVESEELSANIPLTYRNNSIRQNLLTMLSGNMQKGNSNNMVHGVHRNTLRNLALLTKRDNFFVQHMIPRTDIQYAWITGSATTKAIDLGGYQSGSIASKLINGAYDDIIFNGVSDDRVLQLSRKEYSINLLENSIDTVKKIDLSQYTVESYPSGNVNGQGFSLSPRSSIRIDSNGNPWAVLNGGPSLNSVGFLYLEYAFNTPIQLILKVQDAANLGMNDNPLEFGDFLQVDVSIDYGQNWTPYSVCGFGNPNTTEERIFRTQITGLPTPYFVRFEANCASGEAFAIKSIETSPLSSSLANYSFAPWKQTRVSENEVAKELRKQNIISIIATSDERKRQVDGAYSVNAPKRDRVNNFVEPLITSKYKPLKHRFIFKGNSNPLLAHEVIHSYNNNLSMFANKALNDATGVEEVRDQVYDRLREFYSDSNTSEDDNPIAKFLGYSMKEVVYPKEENTGLAKTRARTKYIINKPGFDRDGYDRQFGTQRAFWRDSINDRKRSFSGSFNSQNLFVGFMPMTATFHDNFGASTTAVGGPYAYNSYFSASLDANLGQNSILPIEYLSNFIQILSASQIVTGGVGYSYDVFTSSVKVFSWNIAGEMNNFVWIDTFSTKMGAGLGDNTINSAQLIRNSYLSILLRQNEAPLTNLQNNGNLVTSQNNGQPYLWYFENSSSIAPVPRIRYCAFLGGYLTGSRNFVDPFAAKPIGKLTSSLDFGLRYITDKMSGKKPWFDSYEKYVDDIRGLNKTYSVLPEFRISEHMKYYVSQSGGNFRAPNRAFLSIDGIDSEYRSALGESGLYSNNFFKTFINSDPVKNIDVLRKQNKALTNLNKISFKVSGIKKMLPYNGFYPINRTVQLANLYSDYVNESMHGGYVLMPQSLSPGSTTGYVKVDNNIATYAFKQAALEPLFSPGILFNTIKSGISVDWPAVTSSFRYRGDISLDYPKYRQVDANTPTSNGSLPLSYRDIISLRIPFEAILDPSKAFATQTRITSSIDINSITNSYLMSHVETSTAEMSIAGPGVLKGSLPFTYMVKGQKSVPLYEMSINNFMAECVRFFLEDQKMNSFVSKEESRWKTFDSNKVYYMDVVMKKDPSLVMIEAFTSSFTVNDYTHPTIKLKTNTMHGRYFGYPIDMTYGANQDSFGGSLQNYTIHNDPSYAPYTPPYFEGESFLRIVFSPQTTKNYTLNEIFQQASVTNYFPDLANKLHTSSVAFLNKMGIDSCINLFGLTRLNEIEFDPTRLNKPGNIKQSADSTRNAWVIGPKLETPVLDFSAQPIEQITGTYWTGAGFGRGMWSGYGQIPTGSKGIYFELRESFPMQLFQQGTRSGSLIQQCGFIPQSKKVGQLAQAKEISEAIVVIPYLENASPGNTVEIDGHNFIKINKSIFNKQKLNIENGDAAIKVGDLGSKVNIEETSISRMIDSMKSYVIPPQYNFLEYSDIQPFVMYVFEFKHVLDQQDLSDIWQGLMPKIATTAELDEVEIEHATGPYEFFHGKDLPPQLRWMVFKVKKKAEKSYYSVTADASDDDRFRFDFQVGRKEPEYSYNWPYDYFSLVEFAKVELNLDYENKNLEDKLTQGQTSNFTKNLLDQSKKKRGRKTK